MRVGLALGAGGVMGGAWLTGALDALARETGWDPGGADCVVGTSAGSMIGALCASGVPPWVMRAHSAGEQLPDPRGGDHGDLRDAARSVGAVFRVHPGRPTIGPGSWRLGLSTLARPWRFPPTAVAGGWLPGGLVSTAPLEQAIRRVVPSGWPGHPALWIAASDYATGRRTPFGREGAPQTDLALAVAASCAIPGFYRPVEIAGRRYVDGGLWSLSNLDLLRHADVDVAICLNPTSSAAPAPPGLRGRASVALRRASAGRVRREAKRLRAEGTRVLIIEPGPEDFAAMGPNPMRRRGRHAVLELASRTVGEQLQRDEASEVLAGLPAGNPLFVRRPPGELPAWPELEAAAARRFGDMRSESRLTGAPA